MSYATDTHERVTLEEQERLNAEQEPEQLDDPGPPLPLCQVYELDGGYWGATLSLAGDPEAPNLSSQIKVRYILAVDSDSLKPQIYACAISDFGLTQEQANAGSAVWLVPGDPPPVETEPPADASRETSERGAWGQPAEEQHHERPRDEHGRFVSEEKVEPDPYTEPRREA